jgi:opacity protein-like surface antigen
MRLDAHDAANAARNAVFEKTIAGLRDSLRIVNDEIAALRLEIAKANALAAAANESVEQLTQRFNKMPQFGSLFGNSGFYIGLGTGANFTNGTLYDIGYQEGLNVTMPIGWSKKTFPLGFRGELGVQTFEGALNNRFVNIDPVLYTAQAMLTLNLPMNNAKNNLFYLMGGGGAYFFRRIGEGSALADRLGGETKNVTKFGLTGGAGLEFHILGATSLFVQSTITNVFAEESNVGAGGSKNMRWIPIVAGITLR